MNKRFRTKLGFLLLLLPVFLSLAAQLPQQQARYLTYDEAQPVLRLMDEVLPAELKGKRAEQQAAAWPVWAKAQDAAVRARLRRGDEDTLVNFLLFGTSFTSQPRLTEADLARLKQATGADAMGLTFNARLSDLLRGLAAPRGNERLIFLHGLVVGEDRQPATPEGRTKLREYVLSNLLRVLNEQDGYARAIEAARLHGGANEEFIERSKLYRARGLSLDTTLAPNFAIEESLKALKARSLLAPASVKKIAIVGPGLDFTDKAGGYDFYPEQTIQPFALIDSLLRLGLARTETLRVTAFDLSPRVLGHLKRARPRATAGQAYTLQLPHDPNAKWRPELLKFWQSFGDQIGRPASPIAVPDALNGLRLRAVRINPSVVSRITPVDLNIVFQRMPQDENFDLVIATNILVYYDVFEQSLALANIESLLRPGGLLLSNNALLELPVLKMKSVGYQTTVYSERENDGDHIVWYQRGEN